MTDIAFPSGLVPSSMEWRLERNVARFESPTSRAVQTVARGGDRWHCTLTMPQLTGEDAGILVAWMDQISRPDNWALISPLHNLMSGTESASAAFSNLQPSWRNGGLSGWNWGNLVFSPYTSGGTVVIYSNQNPPVYIQKSFAVVAGAYYLITLDVPPQLSNTRLTASSCSTVLISALASRTYGRLRWLVAAAAAEMLVTIYSGSDTDSFSQAIYGDLSIVRVNLVQSAVSTGTNDMDCFGGQNESINMFRIGQFISLLTINGIELKRLTRDVRQIGGIVYNGLTVNHRGHCQFEPALRAPVAQYNPVVHLNPVCRMRLADANSVSTISAPNFTGTTIELIEDVT